MMIVFVIAGAGLAVTGLLAIYRLIVGPTMTDRVIAIDLLLVVTAGAVAVRIANVGSGSAIDILIYVALLSFAGTVIAARFVEHGGDPE